MAQQFLISNIRSARRRLGVAWFSVLIVTAVLASIYWVPQLREMLLLPVASGSYFQFAILLLSLLVAALAAWYFTRALFYVEYPGDQESTQAHVPTDAPTRALFFGIIVSFAIILLIPAWSAIGLILVLGSVGYFAIRTIITSGRDYSTKDWHTWAPTTLTVAAAMALVLVPNAAIRLIVECILLLALILTSIAVFGDSPLAGGRDARQTDQPRTIATEEIWLPRILGFALILPVCVVYGINGFYYSALLTLSVGFIFLAIVIFRLRPGLALHKWTDLRTVFSRPRQYAKHRRLPRQTYSLLLVVLTASFAIAAAIVYGKSWLAELLGSAAIMYLAVAAWIAFANLVIIYPSRKYDTLSLFLVLPVIAVGMSDYTDRNRMRMLDHYPPTATIQAEASKRQAIGEHLEGWIEHRREAIESYIASEGTRYPLIVVVAEGGGVRSAYWSALALAGIQDKYPGFYCHVFAMSGVSGGSLGTAVFASLLADQIVDRDGSACSSHRRQNEIPVISVAARDALDSDFLASIAAGILFSDLLQLVMPTTWPDRGDFLEDAWERADRGNDLDVGHFERAFDALWTPNRRYSVPSLFLNATMVSTGNRVIASNIAIDGEYFVDAHALQATLGGRVRLSTAVHASARFGYLSPSGVMPLDSNGDSIVDGGYFEENGAMTALEIIHAIRRSPNVDPDHLQLVVIQLQNTEGRTRGDYRLGRNDLIRELMAPIVGLLHGHTAVGSWIEKRTCDGVPAANCIVLSLQDFAKSGDAGVPFAWSLTVNSEKRVERAIEALLDPKTCVATEAIKLIRLFESRRSICR